MMNSIVYKVDDHIATLRVNRPEARNALNWAAQERFAEVVTAVSSKTAVAQSPSVRALIITGTGSQAFVAGGDLKELSQNPTPANGQRLNRVMGAALTQLTQLPIPVIAAVNGDAFGGGCEILTACDLRIAAPHARFSFAQVKVGLTTGWGGTGRLVQLLGQSRATELLLTSRLFDAQEAYRLGLIHRIAPDGVDALTAARRWAEEIIKLPQSALAATKALIHLTGHTPPPEIMQAETDYFLDLWAQPDHLEALNAFVEKRKPTFGRMRNEE